MSKEKNNKPTDAGVADVKSWVFLSHSNLDYERVTFVRNLLERHNKRPIMFFLKCIDEESELGDLLKREIDARDQFILCDSENARRSKWVQDEVRYIKSKGRMYQTINLDDMDEAIEKAVTNFVNRSKVFISYSRCDVGLAYSIKELLSQYGYDVFIDVDNIESADSFQRTMTEALDTSGRSGYQLILLSKNLMKSLWCLNEVSYFISKFGNEWVVPIRIDETRISDEFSRLLFGIPICDVSMIASPKRKMQMIVDFLVQRDQSLSK